MCPGRSQGDPSLKQCQAANLGWGRRTQSCKWLHLPVCVCALSCTLTLSRVPAQSCLLTCMYISSPFFLMHFVHLLFCRPCCYCNLSLSFLPLLPGLLCCLLLHHGPLYSFDNNNIRTCIQGPKVPALCRYMRKDPSKPACWVEKILTVSLVSRSVRGKGLDCEIRPLQNLTLCPVSIQECQK